MNTSRSVEVRDWPTILLIEDEPTRCRLLSEALRAEGFGVAVACNVPDALRQARTCEPNMIVIDPPTASVTRVLNRLRSDQATSTLPLIAIRRAGASPNRGRVYAWPASLVDLDFLREHVWRVVNTHVLARLNGIESTLKIA